MNEWTAQTKAGLATGLMLLVVVWRIVIRLNRPDAEPEVVILPEANVSAQQCIVYSAQLQHYLAMNPDGARVELLRQLEAEMDCLTDPWLSMTLYCSVLTAEPGAYASIWDMPVRRCVDAPPALVAPATPDATGA